MKLVCKICGKEFVRDKFRFCCSVKCGHVRIRKRMLPQKPCEICGVPIQPRPSCPTKKCCSMACLKKRRARITAEAADRRRIKNREYARGISRQREELGLCKKCGGQRDNQPFKYCLKCTDINAQTYWETKHKYRAKRLEYSRHPENKKRSLEKSKKWARDHRDRRKIICTKWRKNHVVTEDEKKRIREARKKRYWDNREASCAKVREWKAKNPDRIKAIKKREYEKNKKRYNEFSKKWRVKNKDRRKEICEKSRIKNKHKYVERIRKNKRSAYHRKKRVETSLSILKAVGDTHE